MKSVLNDKNIEENFFDVLTYTWVDNKRLYRSLCDIENTNNIFQGSYSTGVDYTAVNLAYMALNKKDEKLEYITRLMKDMILSELVEFTRNKNIHRKEYHSINEIGEKLLDEEIYNLLHEDYTNMVAEREAVYLLKETDVHTEVYVDPDVLVRTLNRVHVAILSAANSLIETNDLVVTMGLCTFDKYDTFFKLGAFIGYSTEQLKEMLRIKFEERKNRDNFEMLVEPLTIFNMICDDIVAFMNGSYKNDSKYSDLYKELFHYYNPAKGYVYNLSPEDLAGILSLVENNRELLEPNKASEVDNRLYRYRMNYMLDTNELDSLLAILHKFLERIKDKYTTYSEVEILDYLKTGWVMFKGLEG